MLNSTPRTWVAGETVTAAMLNTEIRDALTGVQSWTAYTPAWTASGTAPALGDGALTGAYLRVGDTIHYWISFAPGSTTTFGTGTYSFTLPVASSLLPNIPHGAVKATNGGVGSYAGIATRGTTTTVQISLPTSATSTMLAVLAQTVPWTVKNTDSFGVTGTYSA